MARYLSKLEDVVETEPLSIDDLEQAKQDMIKEINRLLGGTSRSRRANASGDL